MNEEIDKRAKTNSCSVILAPNIYRFVTQISRSDRWSKSWIRLMLRTSLSEIYKPAL